MEEAWVIVGEMMGAIIVESQLQSILGNVYSAKRTSSMEWAFLGL